MRSLSKDSMFSVESFSQSLKTPWYSGLFLTNLSKAARFISPPLNNSDSFVFLKSIEPSLSIIFLASLNPLAILSPVALGSIKTSSSNCVSAGDVISSLMAGIISSSNALSFSSIRSLFFKEAISSSIFSKTRSTSSSPFLSVYFPY